MIPSQLDDKSSSEQRDPTPIEPLQSLQPVRAPVPSLLADATNKPLPEHRDLGTSAEPLHPIQPIRMPSNVATKPLSAQGMIRRSFTATYAPEIKPPHIPAVPPLPKGGSLFANLLRRKKKTDDGIEELERGLPPPTPPKDKNLFPQPVSLSHSSPLPSAVNHPIRRQRSRSMSDFTVVSHVRGSDEVVIEPEQDERSNSYTLPLRGKWSQEGALPRDPAARARRRRELQLQREREERDALEEETERQKIMKREKDAFLREEMEEEAHRKAEVEQEIRRITAERRRREQLEREEDERRRQALEERKKQDRERRLEEHRRLEEWRKEQTKRGEVAARQAEDSKRREEAERKKKIQQAEAKVKESKGESELTGWITVLSKDSLSWKRRFYKFVGNTIFLYRSPKDLTIPLEKVELRGKLQGLKEWNEGYDDLEAIAFSFVVEFKNRLDGGHWSMYADSEEEKYKILGLFKIAAGL